MFCDCCGRPLSGFDSHLVAGDGAMCLACVERELRGLAARRTERAEEDDTDPCNWPGWCYCRRCEARTRARMAAVKPAPENPS